jgi:probable rRNA maturation factor
LKVKTIGIVLGLAESLCPGSCTILAESHSKKGTCMVYYHIDEPGVAVNTLESIPEDGLGRITVLNRQRQVHLDRETVALFCARLLQSLEQPDRALSVVFIGAQEIRAMNRCYRGKDYPTDVLSFSYGRMKMEGSSFLGEIIIAPAIAVNYAIRYGVTPEKEIRKLLAHGTLHLLGYDHERDDGQMNRMQATLMRRKFFSGSPLLLQKKAAR